MDTIPIEVKKDIIQTRRQMWINTLWAAEKVDLVIAQKLHDPQMEAKAKNDMRIAQTALAMLNDIENPPVPFKKESNESG